MTIQLDGYRVSRTQQLEDLSTGIGESLSATAEQIWTENPSSSSFRASKLEEATYGGFVPGTKGAQFKGPDSPILSKADADKRSQDLGISLDIGERGIPERAYDILAERKREEIKRRAIIDSAPEGFWSGAAQIGTGLAVSIADPINIASAFVPVVGQARYAKMLASASSPAGRAAVRTSVGATEGVVGAALIEPIVLFAAQQEQSEYGLYDSFLNLTFGAVLGGGLHAGLGAVGDVIAKSSPQAKQDLLSSAVAQAVDDRPIDVGSIALTDPSFRAEWRSNQVARAIEGAEVDARVSNAFNQTLDELRPELITRAAKELADEQAGIAIRDLEAGRVPDAFIDDFAISLKSRIADFEAPAINPSAMSPQASLQESIRATDSINAYNERTPQAIDAETDDIITALEDIGVDSATVRAEIDDINQSVDRENAGLREAVLCALGK